MFCALRRTLIRSALLQCKRNITNKFHPNYSNYRRFIYAKSLHRTRNPLKFVRSFASKDYPQHVVVKFPALSPTMESGGVSSWNKKEGDSVSEGDVLAEVETDKATVAVEADDAGFVAKILIPAGTTDVKVGTPICIIVEKKEDVVAFKDFDASKLKQDAPGAPAPSPPPSQPDTPVPAGPIGDSSPKKHGPPQRKPSIDFKKHEASSAELPTQGPSTPPTRAPPLPSSPQPPSGEKFTDHPVSNVRAVIAKRLVQSKKEIPHFYLNTDINLTMMEMIRTMLNAELAKSGVKISVNDIVVKAAALACKEIPETNSSWMDKKIRHYGNVDINVAVSTPTGLITPIVFNADQKTVRDISSDIKELAKKARQGSLKPHEFQGGTFTVSNLGMYGVSQFFAIINPPQSCILAVGAANERLYIKDPKMNTIGALKYMNVCLSCDHRVVDGSVGAQWLQVFKNLIEDPKKMFT